MRMLRRLWWRLFGVPRKAEETWLTSLWREEINLAKRVDMETFPCLGDKVITLHIPDFTQRPGGQP